MSDLLQPAAADDALHQAAVDRRVRQLRWVPATVAAGLCTVTLLIAWGTDQAVNRPTGMGLPVATVALMWTTAGAAALTLLVALWWAGLVSGWQRGNAAPQHVAGRLTPPVHIAMITHTVVVAATTMWGVMAGGPALMMLLAALVATGLAAQAWWVLLRVARKTARLFAAAP